MKVSKLFQKLGLFLLVGVLAFAMTSCGSSQYIDAINADFATYNAALAPVNAQVAKLNADNSLLSDSAWQSDTKTALNNLDQAAKAFANLPQAPDNLKSVDDLAKQIAFETNSAVTIYNQLVDNQDLTQLDAANSHIDNINKLMTQMNDAITAANK
jgi:uncharacterized lipoprotein YehR (DUF1307 family)